MTHVSPGRKAPAALFAPVFKKFAGGLAALFLLVLLPAAAAAQTSPLRISEFRLRGPAGANDEFVEIYNNSDANVTVASASDASTGFAVAASDGVVRFVIPNGTVIPARGHFLGCNAAGYSLASYPAGNGTTATCNATYTADILDNAGIALFNVSNSANFSFATRLDAAGSTSEANALYKEGAGYPALIPFAIDYSFTRRLCTAPMTCTGLPQDTDVNAVDFHFVDTNGTSAGAGQRLGAPGPENLFSPARTTTLPANLLTSFVDPGAALGAAPQLRPRLHLRPAQQLDLRHAHLPPPVHQQHRRAHHAPALPRR